MVYVYNGMKYSYNHTQQCRLISQSAEQNKPAIKEYMCDSIHKIKKFDDIISQEKGYP